MFPSRLKQPNVRTTNMRILSEISLFILLVSTCLCANDDDDMFGLCSFCNDVVKQLMLNVNMDYKSAAEVILF